MKYLRSLILLLLVTSSLNVSAQWTQHASSNFISTNHQSGASDFGLNLEGTGTNPEYFIINNMFGINQQVFYFGHANSTKNIFGISTSGNSGISWDSRFNINQNGSIGIGTHSPNARLHLASNNSDGITIESEGWPELDFISDINDFRSRFTINSSNGDLQLRLGQGLSGVDGSSDSNLLLRQNGNVGIGTTAPSHKLEVNGTVRSKEVLVEANGWPDYVFEEDYILQPLEETEVYIKEHKHLPEIPSAQEMEANGVELGEMNMLLLKKIEELTLYLIEEHTSNKKLHEEVTQLKKEVAALKNK